MTDTVCCQGCFRESRHLPHQIMILFMGVFHGITYQINTLIVSEGHLRVTKRSRISLVNKHIIQKVFLRLGRTYTMEEWLTLCGYEKSGRRVQLPERNDSLLFQVGVVHFFKLVQGAKQNTARIRNKQPQKYQVKCHKNTKQLIVLQIKSVSLY